MTPSTDRYRRNFLGCASIVLLASAITSTALATIRNGSGIKHFAGVLAGVPFLWMFPVATPSARNWLIAISGTILFLLCAGWYVVRHSPIALALCGATWFACGIVSVTVNP